MTGKVYLPYANLNGATLNSNTNFFCAKSITDLTKDIPDTIGSSAGLNTILWNMTYWQLKGIKNEHPEQLSLPDDPEGYIINATFAIHFNFGNNNSHMNPDEQSPDPSQGIYDHIDILPLGFHIYHDANNPSGYTGYQWPGIEIKQDEVNLAFDYYTRGYPLRPISIVDHTLVDIGDQPSEYNIKRCSPFGYDPASFVDLIGMSIDDLEGRSRFLTHPLKLNHHDCGFGSADWYNSFGGSHLHYKDISGSTIEEMDGLNYSVMMRHLYAMTESRSFPGDYTWNPVISGTNRVNINSLMWGEASGWGYFPGKRPWFPKSEQECAIDMQSRFTNNVGLAIFNKLTFINISYDSSDRNTPYHVSYDTPFCFWQGDMGANYAAYRGINPLDRNGSCYNYSDHGLFIFNNDDGHSIGHCSKFNFMLVPSFYELNTAIDLIPNNSNYNGESATFKYRLRDHGRGIGPIGGPYTGADRLWLFEPTTGHQYFDIAPTLFQDEPPATWTRTITPGQTETVDNWNLHTQQKVLQIYQFGDAHAEPGVPPLPPIYSPF